MASDFFYPNTGGVEAHIWQLSHYLMKLGHEVIVITHAYGSRVGIRYMTNSLKVYYLPFSLCPNNNIIWPLVFNTFSLVRQILIREKIDIVHGHSAFSPIAHQVMFHAKTLGINTVFTDHSLFGCDDFGAKVHNQIVKLCLLQCNHIICVSKVGKENEALKLRIKRAEGRSRLGGDDNTTEFIPTSVIPNGVDTHMFTPDPSQRDPTKINIIVNSRLVYRKGIDLLAAVLPKICQLDAKIHFIIAGDGPKRDLLESAVKQNHLSNRVQLLGSVPHDQVRNVLVKGDIFLNTSLIEAFCMAIVEAASCGLQVVSTNVGGLPKVLPPELIILTEPDVDELVDGVKLALLKLSEKEFVGPEEAHNIIANSRNYSWEDVARKTEDVYNSAVREPVLDFKQRISRYQTSSSFVLFKFLFIFIMFIDEGLSRISNWYDPLKDVYTNRRKEFTQGEQISSEKF